MSIPLCYDTCGGEVGIGNDGLLWYLCAQVEGRKWSNHGLPWTVLGRVEDSGREGLLQEEGKEEGRGRERGEREGGGKRKGEGERQGGREREGCVLLVTGSQTSLPLMPHRM